MEFLWEEALLLSYMNSMTDLFAAIPRQIPEWDFFTQSKNRLLHHDVASKMLVGNLRLTVSTQINGKTEGDMVCPIRLLEC